MVLSPQSMGVVFPEKAFHGRANVFGQIYVEAILDGMTNDAKVGEEFHK